MMPEFDLFHQPPLVRSEDRQHAHAVADEIKPNLGAIQHKVIEAFRAHGDMTSKRAEALPEFFHYGRSTVQKRMSELFLVGVLELVPDVDQAIYRLNEERITNPLKIRTERCEHCGHVQSVRDE